MDELKQLQDMMTELIRIVGNTNAKLENLESEMNRRFDTVETRFSAVETRFDIIETRIDNLKNEIAEVKSEIKGLRGDMEFQYQKTAKNEMDIHRIKKLIIG